ncbi:MAG TPA: caspase family protein [Rubricoccaceae bacterium]|nr:caspase family protein [Rubricoccaceae bacterium]
MRTSPFLLLAALLALPAAAQPAATQAAGAAAAHTLDAGDVVFGQVTTSHPFIDDQGARLHYEVYAYEAQANERVTFSARSLDFIPGVVVLDGPGLNPEYPNMEVSADGQAASMDFYAPQMGTYHFGVVVVEPDGNKRSGPWTFQARLDARPPMDYAAAYPGGGDPSERYALLVGVNDYPAIDADLNGTVNDVMKVRQVLIERYGFRPENIVVLTNADATRDHVIEAFRRHLGQAGPSGSAVFYYSGHGTQIPDGYAGYDASDEEDKADEALVLWGTGGNFGFLIDEELGGLADNLAAGHRLLILDNCHSGTGTRDGEEQLHAIRYLDVEAPGIREHAQVPDQLIAEADDAAGPAGHVLLAAARSDQYSIEASGMSENGESGGIFTYYLVNALKTADPDEPLSALMERVRADVMRTTEALKYPEQPEGQEPQAEGTRVGEPIRAFLMR